MKFEKLTPTEINEIKRIFYDKEKKYDDRIRTIGSILSLSERMTRYNIKEMKKIWGSEPKQTETIEKHVHVPNTAKILVFDVETSLIPVKGGLFRAGQQYISPEILDGLPNMITWSAKWLLSKNVMHDKLTSKEAINRDDARITKSLWELIREADIVIAHNGDRFDIPMMNTRFLINGLTPPESYISIDTLKSARKHLKLPSNKLAEIAKNFNKTNKIETNRELWENVLLGYIEAINEMQDYNDQDVLTLEEIYLLFRPWIKPHPNVSIFMDSNEPRCIYCGSKNVLPTDGYYYTSVSKFAEYRCSDCGGISRAGSNEIEKDIRKFLNRPIQRL